MKSSSWIPSLNHCFCHRLWLRSSFICTQSQLRRELHWFQNSCYLKLRQNHALLMRTVSLIYINLSEFFFYIYCWIVTQERYWMGGWGCSRRYPPINRTAMVKGIKMTDLYSTQLHFQCVEQNRQHEDFFQSFESFHKKVYRAWGPLVFILIYI